MSRQTEIRPSYRPHTAASLRDYIAADRALAHRLGGSPQDWTVEEVGDGNLNLVFKLRGTEGGIAVKQALPYVRLVGESWPLPLSRAHYEHMALTEEARLAPGLVPEIYHYDEGLALIAMELLEPHVVMRRSTPSGLAAIFSLFDVVSEGGWNGFLRLAPKSTREDCRRIAEQGKGVGCKRSV